MIENQSLVEIENKSSNKSFGILISIILLLISLYFLIINKEIKIIFFATSLFIFILSFFKPRVFQIPNIFFIYLGFKIGGFVSPIIMFLIYIFTIYPIGVIMRAISADFGQNKLFKDKKSYWENYDSTNDDLKDQF